MIQKVNEKVKLLQEKNLALLEENQNLKNELSKLTEENKDLKAKINTCLAKDTSDQEKSKTPEDENDEEVTKSSTISDHSDMEIIPSTNTMNYLNDAPILTDLIGIISCTRAKQLTLRSGSIYEVPISFPSRYWPIPIDRFSKFLKRAGAENGPRILWNGSGTRLVHLKVDCFLTNLPLFAF